MVTILRLALVLCLVSGAALAQPIPGGGGGGGSVSSVSVATANGLAGTSSGGATPALTLSTTVSGILSGNGTAISAASTTGSGAVVEATSPALTTPNLGTPSAVNLTNATALPCAAMPALSGGVTSSAGSCVTTGASVPTSAITGNVTDEKCVVWDSTTSVTAQTIDFPVEWATYTIGSTKAKVGGGGSFTYAIKIGGTGVTSCNVVTVNSSSNTNTTCTGANTGSANDIISVVIASPSGTVNQAYVCPVFAHTVN